MFSQTQSYCWKKRLYTMIIPLAWKVFFHLLPVLASFHGHTETEEDHLKLAGFTTNLHYENCHSNDLGPLLICKKENN